MRSFVSYHNNSEQVFNDVSIKCNVDLHVIDTHTTLVQWAESAGLVASQAHFEDIYGLDPEVCLIDVLMVKNAHADIAFGNGPGRCKGRYVALSLRRCYRRKAEGGGRKDRS